MFTAARTQAPHMKKALSRKALNRVLSFLKKITFRRFLACRTLKGKLYILTVKIGNICSSKATVLREKTKIQKLKKDLPIIYVCIWEYG